jgi:hypothetical protein
MSLVRQCLASADRNGRLQVVGCADVATGGRIFAVQDGLMIANLGATGEQSFALMRRLRAETTVRDLHSHGES